MYKAVIFDIGQTLVEYNKPLNWSQSYRPVLQRASQKCGLNLSEQDYEKAVVILSFYNTRTNPREYEVTSQQIFTEIFDKLHIPKKYLNDFKTGFYLYFNTDTSVFKDVIPILKILNDNGILVATLSDVAYGMDDEFALSDISTIRKYIQYPLTSNYVGYRKPSIKGLQILSEKMGIDLSQMIMAGDEEKDILCANNAGVLSVLINRSNEIKNYGQNITIHSLIELSKLLTD